MYLTQDRYDELTKDQSRLNRVTINDFELFKIDGGYIVDKRFVIHDEEMRLLLHALQVIATHPHNISSAPKRHRGKHDSDGDFLFGAAMGMML